MGEGGLAKSFESGVRWGEDGEGGSGGGGGGGGGGECEGRGNELNSKGHGNVAGVCKRLHRIKKGLRRRLGGGENGGEERKSRCEEIQSVYRSHCCVRGGEPLRGVCCWYLSAEVC